MIINKYQGNGGGGSATSAETAEFAFIAGESEILGGHTDAPSASDFDAASLNITAAEWSDSEPNTTRGAKKGGTRSVAGEKFFKVPADIEALITSGVVANGQPYLVADFGYGDNASGVPNTLHIWWDFIEEGQPIGFMFAANYYCEDWDWKWIDSVDLYDENNPYEIPICGSDGLKWCLAWYSAGTYLKIWVHDSEGYVLTDAINTHNVGLWGLCIKKEDRWESVIPQMKTINGESIIGEGNITLATTGGAQGPMGMQGPQGIQGDKGDLGYQGPQGSASGGDSHILKASSAVPQDIENGDVYSTSAATYQYKAGGQGDAASITWYFENDDPTGFPTRWGGHGFEMTILGQSAADCTFGNLEFFGQLFYFKLDAGSSALEVIDANNTTVLTIAQGESDTYTIEQSGGWDTDIVCDWTGNTITCHTYESGTQTLRNLAWENGGIIPSGGSVSSVKLLDETTGVQSVDVRNIVKLTQAEYDALVSGGTVDANTLYIIASNNQ